MTMETPTPTSPTGGGRIPQALQDVFVASNKGNEVHHPPPEASKVYLRNWVHQSTGNKKSSSLPKLTLFAESTDKVKNFQHNVPDTTRQAGEKARRTSFKESAKISPQSLLDEHMVARGYSTDTYRTLNTAYYSPPTDLQRASYGPYMIRLVKESQVEQLREAVSAGMSPNPCNQFGESLVHMACRRGDAAILQVLLDAGASVQVVDDYGRTPLHDACWAANPAFDVVEALLQRDNRLFYMKDCRGSLPLSYVHRDHFPEWDKWLGTSAFLDTYFPKDKATGDEAPELCKLWPNARPLANPRWFLPLELAKMVADGKMTPEEAHIVLRDDSTAVEESGSDFDSDFDSDEDDDDIHVDAEIFQLAQVRLS